MSPFDHAPYAGDGGRLGVLGNRIYFIFMVAEKDSGVNGNGEKSGNNRVFGCVFAVVSVVSPSVERVGFEVHLHQPPFVIVEISALGEQFGGFLFVHDVFGFEVHDAHAKRFSSIEKRSEDFRF